MASGNPPGGGPTKLCIRIDDRAVMQAVAAARDFAVTAALPAEVAARLAIIVEEIVANLVDHADLPADTQLELDLAQHGDRVAITLRDPAAPFDPRHVTAKARPIPERGGAAGLALVQAFARIEGYDREGDCNVLRLSLPTTAQATPGWRR